jgi:transmembrane sensor
MNPIAKILSRKRPSRAAAWVVRRASDPVRTEVRFFRWLRRDPANGASFARLQRIWNRIGKVEMTPVLADYLQEARGLLQKPRRAERGWCGPLLNAALTRVAVVLFVELLWGLFAASQIRDYAAPVGEIRRISLSDGSTVFLNADSSIDIDLNDRHRLIRLDRGEAFFHVARDDSRPFLVQAGDYSVRAVGTKFDVRRDGKRVQIAVVEGEIEVQGGSIAGRLPLAAGTINAIAIEADGHRQPTEVAPLQVASWRSGKLIYNGTQLRDVIADFNRYSLRPLVLVDASIGDLSIGGTFDIGDQRTLLLALREIYGINARTHANRVELTRLR